MTIVRTPRPAEPDTRRNVAGGRYTGPSNPPLGLKRTLELRARARRANLVVSTREEPRRPQPRQEVFARNGLIKVTGVQTNGDRLGAGMDAFAPWSSVTLLPYRVLRVVCSW